MLVGMEIHRVNIPYAVPKASSEPLAEISQFLKPFAPLFRRSQSRHSLERYVTGLLTVLDRMNCDTPSLRHSRAPPPSASNTCSPMPIGTPSSSMALG